MTGEEREREKEKEQREINTPLPPHPPFSLSFLPRSLSPSPPLTSPLPPSPTQSVSRPRGGHCLVTTLWEPVGYSTPGLVRKGSGRRRTHTFTHTHIPHQLCLVFLSFLQVFYYCTFSELQCYLLYS